METETKLIKNPIDSCRLGQGQKCCIFLTSGAEGFTCEKNTGSSIEKTLTERLENGTTNAKGVGNWNECEYK